MKTKEFEDSTRQTALEIITTLAEENPKMIKSLGTKIQTDLFPAIAIMLTGVANEDDLAAWA